MRVISGMVMVLIWQVPDVLAQGCAMCGTVGPTDAVAAEAFNGSILFMVAMPYLLFISIAGWIVYKHHWHKIHEQREVTSESCSRY